MSISQSEIEIIAHRVFQAGVTYAIRYRDRSLESPFNTIAEEGKALDHAIATVRDELVKAGVPVQRKRRAIVTSPSAGQHHPLAILDTVRNYLPSNFTACESNGTIHGSVILIEGYDRAGWTLDAYVIPRLASGLIVAKEVE